MDKKKFEEIRAKLLEERKNKPKVERQEPYELFGVECGNGWKHLYQPITDYINEYNQTHKEEPIKICQIKEKFGGLRYYVDHYTDNLRKMIREAEEKSYNTCEICGKHIDKPITENHWIYAECEECHQKLKKKISKVINMNSENS